MTAQEYSRQLQEKFELYLLALVFTVLALAIQTAKLGNSDAADFLELLSWALLLISGISGLSRLEWVPVAHHALGGATSLRNEKRRFVELLSSGVDVHPIEGTNDPVPTQELIDDRSAAIVRVEKRVKDLERSILRKYSIHKWCFIIAIVLLACGRGYSVAYSPATRHLTAQCSEPPTTAENFKR